VIILTNYRDKLCKYLPNFDNDEIYAHTLYDDFLGKKGYFIVLNFDNENRKITHGAIAHEADHVAGFVLYDRGITADFMNDEAHAYLVEWVVDEVYKFINKHNFKTT